MQAENLVFDKSGERKIVEEIREVLPNIGISIFAQTLIVEAVYLSNLTRLVITAENSYSLWITDLKCY